MAQPPEDDTFFSRWSKRKRGADTPTAPEAQAPATDGVATPESDEALSEEDLAALPLPDAFTLETDIRPFLQKGVPAAMRNAALRKKWLLTPSIRDHADPAVDYAWDWNTPGGVPGDGLGPSAEKAAEMLRDLTAPRQTASCETSLTEEAETVQSVPPQPPQPPRPASDLRDGDVAHISEGAESAAENADQKTAPQTDAASAKITQNQLDMDDALPRKRHGGAIPG
jgi:hypothetical protein